MALNEKQKQFCEQYLIDFNATQAAIRAGYSIKTAYSIGSENLTKPEIKEAIRKRLDEAAITKEQTVKLISDIAQSSLNEYFTLKTKVEVEKIEVHLSAIITQIKIEIEDADKFRERVPTDEKGMDDHYRLQEHRRQRIVMLEIELERNPKATRIIDGPEKLVKVPELDLAKLVSDKERGKIKSIVPTEHGLKVEMYPADSALRDMARIHDAFEKDNKRDIEVKASLAPDQLSQVLKTIRENAVRSA
jgi:phage terminase small subunit